MTRNASRIEFGGGDGNCIYAIQTQGKGSDTRQMMLTKLNRLESVTAERLV